MKWWLTLLLFLAVSVLADTVVLDFRHVPVRVVIGAYARLVGRVPMYSTQLPDREFEFTTGPSGLDRDEAARALLTLLEGDGYRIENIASNLVRVTYSVVPVVAVSTNSEQVEPVVTVPLHVDHAVVQDVGSGVSALSSMVGTNLVKVYVDPRTSTVFLTGHTGDVVRASSIVRVLDRPVAQVSIRAAITEVTVDKEGGEGLSIIQRALSGGGVTVAGGSVGSVAPQPQPLPGSASAALSQLVPSATMYTTFKQLHLDTALQLVSSVSDMRILSTPFVEVADGRPASVTVGQSVPYISSQLNQVIGGNGSNGLGQVVGSSVSFLQTAITLKVTPHVSTNGDVALDVEQDANDSAGSVVLQGNPVPIQDQRTTISSVVVHQGDLLALGGLVQDTVSTNRTSVPFLGSLPWVGGAFRQETRSDTRTELIVFIEPTVTRKEGDFEHEIK